MSGSGPNRRSQTIQANLPECPVFGFPREINNSYLPTYADVIRHVNYLRHNSGKSNPDIMPIIVSVSELVCNIWVKASVPVINLKTIKEKIKSYYVKYQNIMKNYNRNKNKENAYKEKLQNFQTHLNKLFDICSCKCPIQCPCSEVGKFKYMCDKTPTSCICPKEHKVSEKERMFLQDQRSFRRMGIGKVDIQYSKNLLKREQRNTYENSLLTTSNTCTITKSDTEEAMEDQNNDSDDCTDNAENYQLFDLPSVPIPSTSFQMRQSLPTVARVSRRYNLSVRCTAEFATAVLEDMDLITKQNKSKIIDKSKISRERQKLEIELQKEASCKTQNFRGLYFDGRKDNICFQI